MILKVYHSMDTCKYESLNLGQSHPVNSFDLESPVEYPAKELFSVVIKHPVNPEFIGTTSIIIAPEHILQLLGNHTASR